MDQDRFALQGGIAQPKRWRKVAASSPLHGGPAVFMLGPSRKEITLQKEEKAFVKMRLGQIRFDSDRLSESIGGVIQSFQLLQRDPEIAPSFHQVGLDHQGAPVEGNGLIELPERSADGAQVAECLDAGFGAIDGPPIFCRGTRNLARGMQSVAECVMRDRK